MVLMVLMERRGIFVKKEVKLSIQIQPKDMHHFLVQQNYRSFSGLFGVFLSSAALVYFLCSFQDNEPFKNIILLLIGALFLVVQPLQLKLSSIQKIKAIPMFQQPLEYVLTEEGIQVHQNDQEAEVTWKDIQKVVETKKSIFVYTSPVSAFIFPKNQCESQAGAVKEMIKDHVKEERCKWTKR